MVLGRLKGLGYEKRRIKRNGMKDMKSNLCVYVCIYIYTHTHLVGYGVILNNYQDAFETYLIHPRVYNNYTMNLGS